MRYSVFLILSLLSSPALADWRLDEGVAIVDPSQTNGNIELLAVSCGDPVLVEVYARGGAVQPAEGDVQADYFYKPGMVRARIDGKDYPLAAAGSGGAVVLFAEGPKSADYMGPISPAFVAALKSGKVLELGFDITPAKAADGSALETTATFALAGATAALEEALGGCPR